jgi:hypothetical protein
MLIVNVKVTQLYYAVKEIIANADKHWYGFTKCRINAECRKKLLDDLKM